MAMSRDGEEEKSNVRSLYVSGQEAKIIYAEISKHKPSPVPDFSVFLKRVRSVKRKGLDAELAKIHRELFDRESFVLRMDEVSGLTADTRVFPSRKSNILLDIDDFFRQGIAFYRAFNTILECAGKSGNACDASFQDFCQIMQLYKNAYNSNSGNDKEQAKFRKKAYKRLTEFNAILANELVQQEIGNRKQAQKALNLVRGYQFKMTHTERQCTIVENNYAAKKTKTLYFSTPSTFSSEHVFSEEERQAGAGAAQAAVEEKTEKTEKSVRPVHGAVWTDYTNQKWFKDVKSKLGNQSWVDNFYRDHIEAIKILSPVPMMRSTPNPANASDTTIAVFDEAGGDPLHVFNTSRVAITEPYETSEKKGNRTTLTKFVHQQLMTDERIKAMVSDHFVRWNKLYGTNKDVVTIPYLHQTLIGDGVRLSGDAKKSTSMLDNKTLGNIHLRGYLNRRRIYVNKNDPNDIKIFHYKEPHEVFKKSENFKDYRRVTFDVLETNHCINIHHKRTRVRNNDVEHLRRLIARASDQIELMKNLKNASDGALIDATQLDIVQKFLKSSDYSLLTPYKSREKAVKEALAVVSQALHRDTADPQLARNLDLVMKCAVELKCTVHETLAGALRRKMSNWFLDIPVIGRPSKWVLVDLPALAIKAVSAVLPWGLLGLAKWAKHQGTRRKALWTSVYAGMLNGALGVNEFGCMSNEDRAGEKAAFERAMITQFATENGKLIGFNDSPKDKKTFFETYGKNMQDTHNFAKTTTDAPGIKWGESVLRVTPSGLLLEQQSKEELALSRQFDSARKGKFSSGKLFRKPRTAEQFGAKVLSQLQRYSTFAINSGATPVRSDNEDERTPFVSPGSPRSSSSSST